MISWHLLYEQLKNKPELLEEERAVDNVALNNEIDLPQQDEKKDQKQEQEALRKLLGSLGNAGLQKLINMQTKSKAKTPGKKNTRPVAQPALLSEKETSHEPLASTMQSQGDLMTAPRPESSSAKQGNEVNPADNAHKSANHSAELVNDSAIAEAARTAQPEVDDLLKQASAAEIKGKETTADTRKQQEKNLLRFISSLPAPSPALWQQISDLYLLLDGARQKHLLEAIVKFVRTAPRSVQETFFSTVVLLPANVSKGAFVSILLEQLLAVFTSLQVEPEVEPPPPEDPDI